MTADEAFEMVTPVVDACLNHSGSSSDEKELRSWMMNRLFKLCYDFYKIGRETSWENCPHRHITQTEMVPICTREG